MQAAYYWKRYLNWLIWCIGFLSFFVWHGIRSGYFASLGTGALWQRIGVLTALCLGSPAVIAALEVWDARSKAQKRPDRAS